VAEPSSQRWNRAQKNVLREGKLAPGHRVPPIFCEKLAEIRRIYVNEQSSIGPILGSSPMNQEEVRDAATPDTTANARGADRLA
jgi:hypothetical protein